MNIIIVVMFARTAKKDAIRCTMSPKYEFWKTNKEWEVYIIFKPKFHTLHANFRFDVSG